MYRYINKYIYIYIYIYILGYAKPGYGITMIHNDPKHGKLL